MPLSNKGSKIMRAMKKEYGTKKGEKVFYASKNKGTIKSVEEKINMNWQDKVYENLVETRASKKTQAAAKKATKRAPLKRGGKKVAPDAPRHGKKSFHSIQDPHNDQYNREIGTKDE